MSSTQIHFPQTCVMLTTNALAEQLGMRAQSLRKRFAATGSYFGVRPVKLPNGQLRWPTDAVERLMKGRAA
ncbi:DNA-binding protein [Chromobacterium sp. ATCC 53434]|uniref:DNA-binding protein n=1 Tax=Chromobacterium sp. (strain ATCC 53434 / SC 14030) TaxID=2059672 RepID=UPI000C7905FC|nr:DNA-binding protein [Chromobacterium sp. ATCC 53434]AUH49785.1 DNA-binding protein [Chromobacterium sp. ATCC 53434]